MSQVANIVVAKVCPEMSPGNKEAGAKTDCKAASCLHVDCAPLFAALPATEATETVQAAQTNSGTATEMARIPRPCLDWSIQY